MRRVVLAILPVLTLGAAPATAGPNVPLCLAIQKNFADCQQREARKRHRWEWERQREYEEFGEWGGPWEHEGPPNENCAAWLVALKANNCF
jgi:hypothetical protein